MNRFRFAFFFFLFFLAGLAQATQVRVDSTGGLYLVMTDETADINPYNEGNPAGLVLLPAQTRIQFSLPWDQITTGAGTSSQNFGLSAFGAYQGFLEVTPDQWAFQVSGSLSGSQFQEGSLYTSTGQSGAGSAMVGKASGPFDFGVEAYWNGGGFTYPNGTESDTALDVILGALAGLPLSEGDQPISLRLGGAVLFSSGPAQTTYAFNDGSFFGTETDSTSTVIGEPCLFLEVPGTFQAGVQGFIHVNSYGTSLTSTNNFFFPSVPEYHSGDDDNFTLNALYKWKIPLETSGDPHPLTFNNGIRFEFLNDNYKGYEPNQTNFYQSQEGTNQLQAGLGLERLGNFTLGAQLNFFGLNSTGVYLIPHQDVRTTYSMAQITLGGEKWLSPHWALRAGLMYEDDNNPLVNGNGNSQSEGYYELYPGQEIQGVLANLGAGYQDKNFQADARIWFEQPQSLAQGQTGPAYQLSLFGAALSLAFLWGS